jgi:hypothetical protein
MGYSTARVSVQFEQRNGAQFTFLGRTVVFFPASMQLTGAEKVTQQSWRISGGLSAQPLDLNPLGVSAPVGLLVFLADQPVDLRVGSPSTPTFLSAVMLLTLGGQVSSLFVTTSGDTTIWLAAAGGSNATLTATVPTP